MEVHDDTRTLGRARLTFAKEADIDLFAATLDKFERGEITADEWRTFRLVRGTYGQRQSIDAQMLRVKIPQGLLTADQLEAVGEVSDRFSRGFAHITTRQNVQFHFVKLHDVEPAMRLLADSGLTTREACGNSVRNVTACPFAGVSGDEIFDVTPYADALTRYFLFHRISSKLPRKFKIGFEGCSVDHAKAGINDIAFEARIQDGHRGFRVSAGGGTSTMATAARLLHEFVPAGEMLTVAEAIIRVFHRLGDYQHKQRNRMKFLIKTLGWDRWRQEYETTVAEVRAEGGIALPFDPEHPPVEEAPDWVRAARPAGVEIASRVSHWKTRGPGIHPHVIPVLADDRGQFDRWLKTNVRPQKQHGYSLATVTIPLGDLTTAQFQVLAELARAFGDGTVRTTVSQNLVFRWIPNDQLHAFYRRLAAAGLGLADADTIADVTSCPGAESCRIAVTQSRGLGKLLHDYIQSNPRLIGLAEDVDIRISGCPNGCGQHHIGTIGFQGSLRKVDGRAVPQYFVMVGGGVDADGTTFGRLAAKVPARRAPIALSRLATMYATEKRSDETAIQFFRRIDVSRVKALLADLEVLTAATAQPEDFIDLAESTAFAPEMLEGECSA
jgi:sulfite reductase beta subunit-like hemoprotein